ncbi:MAG: nucleotide exchange factor GrpE [Chroococcidiopsidaceae cyanobacterium CP_BM_RX_35]|nr:nucleotide exchange factor GrpE [Chroococcidiopsidaceae cyanobacterium CP_BM_RX_35]
MDEEKQIDNTAHGQGDSSEEKRAMASDTTAAQTNLNQEVTEPERQEAAQPNVEAVMTGEENAVAEAESQAALSELAKQVESLRTALEERSGQYMRIAADFENFRKRTLKEKEELEHQVKSATIAELLPVVDNFERARAHLKPETEAEINIHRSYQSVYRQMVDTLKRLGVSVMRPEGMEFDPNLHEAVMRQPTDEHPEGTVLEELVRGYFLGDRVLRHAMVKVAAPALLTEENSPSPAAETES